MRRILLAIISLLPLLSYGQSMRIAPKQIEPGDNDGKVIITRNGVNVLDSIKWLDVSGKPTDLERTSNKVNNLNNPNNITYPTTQAVSNAGFLTSETDPVYTADKPNIIFSGDNNSLLNNDAGYITSSSIPNPQTLSLSGHDLSLSGGGGTVTIPDNNTTYTGSTSITLNGTSFRRAALTGDVTAAANSNTTTIANSSVTFPKIQDIATQTIMGRYGSGTGNVQSITLGSGLTLNGSGVLSATIPTVNNATLTLATSGIATGSQTFTANSATNKTFTVNVPGTNIGSSISGNTLFITSSTGSNTSVTLPGTPNLNQVTTVGNVSNNDIELRTGSQSASYYLRLGSYNPNSTRPAIIAKSSIGGVGLLFRGAADATAPSRAAFVFEGYQPDMTTAITGGNLFRLSNGNNSTGSVLDISWNGKVTMPFLSGSGNRMVVANSAGELGTQSIPAPQTLSISGQNLTISGGNTVNVPGTNLGGNFNATTGDLNVTSSTGNNATIGMPALQSGEYAPSVYNLSGFTSVDPSSGGGYDFIYSQVGNVVTVSGSFEYTTDGSVGTSRTFDFDPPIPVTIMRAWGTGSYGVKTNGADAAVIGASNMLRIMLNDDNNTTHKVYFTCQYILD